MDEDDNNEVGSSEGAAGLPAAIRDYYENTYVRGRGVPAHVGPERRVPFYVGRSSDLSYYGDRLPEDYRQQMMMWGVGSSGQLSDPSISGNTLRERTRRMMEWMQNADRPVEVATNPQAYLNMSTRAQRRQLLERPDFWHLAALNRAGFTPMPPSRQESPFGRNTYSTLYPPLEEGGVRDISVIRRMLDQHGRSRHPQLPVDPQPTYPQRVYDELIDSTMEMIARMNRQHDRRERDTESRNHPQPHLPAAMNNFYPEASEGEEEATPPIQANMVQQRNAIGATFPRIED